MKTLLRNTLLLAATIAASAINLFAQTAWTGATDSNWNNAGNWTNGVPGVGVLATLTNNSTVTYTAPMGALSFAGLDTAGRLTLSAVGFNIDAGGAAAYTGRSNSVMTVNAGGVVVVTNSGNWSVTTNSIIDVQGGALIVTNNTAATAITFGPAGNQSTANAAGFTNNGGTVVFSQPFNLRGRFSRFHMTGGSLDMQGGGGITEANNDQERLWLINGGTANLGNFSVSRTVQTLGNGGLVISNGVVNATSLQIGNNASRAGSSVLGGVLTNTGSFTIADRVNAATTGERRVFFYVRGGTVVSTVAQGIIVGNQSNSGVAGANIYGGNLDVGGTGTLYTEGVTLVKDATLSNVHGNLLLGGSGTIYLGSVGLVGNVGVSGTTYAVTLSGGTIAAKSTSFGIGADLTFSSGSTTIKAADAANTPYDITLTNTIAGSGTFVKTGGGKFTILGVGTHTGTISINEGTLALDGSGSIPTTSVIAVGSGATFDAGPAFTLNAAKTLRGTGTVTNNVTTVAGSFLKPADDAVIGTLTFTNNLTETGGAKNSFDITSPATKDLLIVRGTLDISAGVQEVNVTALGTPPVGTYELIRYGTLVGDVTNNLTLLGAVGYLRTNATGTAIELVLTADRNATNLVWRGDSVLNNWDANATFNWTNNGSGAVFKFLPGDNVTFNNQGSVTPAVNLVGGLQPSAVTANASVDYTFNGDGKITGLTGMTKTNSGRLTVLTTNDYTGVTTLAGGALSVSNLANGGTASAIGAALSPAANIVFNGGTLEYLGETKSINRGATIQSGGGTVSVFDPASALTISGNVTGAGLLTKTGDGQLNLTSANDYAGGTLVTVGSVRTAQGSGVNISALGTNTLTLNGTVNPAAFVFGGDLEVLTNLLTVVGNNNFITNNGNNTVVTMSGTGTLTLEGTGANVFTIDGNMTAFSGTLYVNTLPNLRLFPSSGSSNAVFDLGVGSGFLNNRNGTTAYLGALIGGPSSQLRGASSADNPSTYVIGGKNLSTTFDGQIVNGPSAPRYANIVKHGTATLALTGTSTYTGSTTVSNGVLALSGSGSFDNSTNIVIVAPGVLDVSARGDTTLNLGSAAAQVLRGNGTNYGSLNVGSLGTVAPGLSIGTLYVTNTVTLGGNVLMEVDRNGGSPLADKLVAPSIAFGGILTIVNTGLPLQVGDTFDLFDGALSGLFTTVAGGYYTWNTNNLAVNGTITVTGVLPTPSISSVAISGPDITFSSTNGAPLGPIIVLSSTNVALPMTNWSPVLTNAYDGVGYFNFTTPVSTNSPAEQFYRLRVQ